MEVGLNQRHLAHRNVHRGIRLRISFASPGIVENGEVVHVAEISTRNIWERTNP